MSDFTFGLMVLFAFCVTGIMCVKFLAKLITAQINQIKSGMQTAKEQTEKPADSQASKSVQATKVQKVLSESNLISIAEVVDYTKYEVPCFLRKQAH